MSEAASVPYSETKAPESPERLHRGALRLVTLFQGGSHLTLISHPNAVTATIASAILSVR
jgi:hypothetical protein